MGTDINMFIDGRDIMQEDAVKWVDEGISFFENQNKTHVSNPDAHNISYLSTKELEQALVFKLEKNDIEQSSFDEYDMILSFLKNIELSGREARVVFWFEG